MSKILYVTSTLKRSGPTNQLHSLVKHLDRSQFEPHIITLSPEPADTRWTDYEALGARLYTLGLSRAKGLLLSKKNLRSLVGQINPDVIHTHGIRADILNASALKGLPSLCTSHNYPFADYPTKFGKLRGSLMARQHMAAFRKINVMACSLAIQTQLKAHGIDAGVVQNGVDIEKFQTVDMQRKIALRQKLGLPKDALVLLSVGSLIPRKDMSTLIIAFEQTGLKNARLLILGDGPQKGMLCQQADASVQMPGNVNNVSEYLGAADLFVSTALSEGLPNTVLEAMASGLPCLLSDIPPHRALNGDDGQYFACGDVAALAEMVGAQDQRQLADLGHLSRHIVEQKFSAKTMTLAYQEKYIQILGGEHG